jgi:putative ABC transport system permease protein
MIRNYLTSVLRYVSKNKAFSVINVSGLVIGMAACMLITQFVLHEFSYDDFHSKKDRIFRLQLDRYNKGELTTRWASGCAGIGPDLKTNFPEVEHYVRLRKSNALLSTGDVYFKEDAVYYCSEDFFRVFSVKLVAGVDSTVLKQPFKMAISKSLAKKYFGPENPIGRTLRNNGETEYEITGVFEDLPANSHMKIDAFLSFASYISLVNDPVTSWNWDGFTTYVLLNETTDPAAFEAKLPPFVTKQAGETMAQDNASMVFHLQRINDIHLDSDFIGEFKPNGNRRSTYFLAVVAVLILVIAWINYVNLATAKSIERAREVGVRKVMGGFRSQLIQQFLFESLLLNVLAIVISVVLVFLLTPWFSSLTSRPVDYLLFKEKLFWLWTGGLIVGGAAISGFYPALVLSGYKPVDVLKGRFKNSGQGVLFRKGMVVIQFIASITLIVGTFTVYRQLKFMQDQELGVNLDQTLVVHSPNVIDSTYEKKFQVFKQQIAQYPEVLTVAASTSVPGGPAGWNAGGIRRLSQREDEANQYRVIMMDHDFIKLYGLDVISGRGFSGETTGEAGNVMLNEAACRLMGFTNFDQAINERIYFWGDTFRIVGVLKNYHQESLKKAYDPLVFRYSEAPGGYYSIRLKTSDIARSLSRFQNHWNEMFPGNPFIHFFLDEHYNQQYEADQQFGKIFGMFSGLAIFIACLGLFGLSSLTAIQRTKEIGVRKVLGASVPGLLSLMSKDYLILILIALTVATPLTWWIMTAWLQAFAYRLDLTWWIFAMPSVAVILIALLTVSIHTMKAARTNPSRSLRYE